MSMPKSLEGVFFTEIIPELITEIRSVDLITLGAYVLQSGKREIYQPLKECVCKVQVVKFVSIRAIEIENELKNMVELGAVIFWPLGQIDHSLNITDCVFHTKSALDSIAIFLTNFFKLDVTGGDRDLKKGKFRDLIIKKDKKIGRKIKEIVSWLTYLQEIRDELIHRSILRSYVINGPSEVGILPIIKKPDLLGSLLGDIELNKENFYSTSEYVQYHYLNLVSLVKTIIRRCIEIEKKHFKRKLIIPEEAEKSLILFPIRVTQNMTASKIVIGPRDIKTYFTRRWPPQQSP